MMLATVNPEAAAAIGNIKKVGVGNVVVYHARAGYMRDRRSDFPALVMRQHDDDGSLDLLVFMEREDFALEERVAFQSHNQPHHCWSVPTDPPGDAALPSDIATPDRVMAPINGSAEPVLRPMQDVLVEIMGRVQVLENRPKPGRPAKPKAA